MNNHLPASFLKNFEQETANQVSLALQIFGVFISLYYSFKDSSCCSEKIDVCYKTRGSLKMCNYIVSINPFCLYSCHSKILKKANFKFKKHAFSLAPSVYSFKQSF